MSSQPLWAPSLTLLHTPHSALQSAPLQCSGLTKHSKRCRWDISPSLIPQISTLLTSLSSLSPDAENAVLIKGLRELAPLCLCRDFHQHQSSALVARWCESISEVKGLSHGDGGKDREKEVVDERKVEELTERLGEMEKEKKVWIERCTEAESAKERLLMLVTRRAKEAMRFECEIERLESALRDAEINTEVEKRGNEELRGRLVEQNRISKQLMESLEELRSERVRAVQETEKVNVQLVAEQQSSKQRGQTLDEVKKRTAELGGKIDGLSAQLSTLSEEKKKLETTLDEAEKSRSDLSKELETTRAQLASERETTAQLRTELTSLKSTLTKTQQDLQSSQQASLNYTAETTKLKERIKELETKIERGFYRRLKRRVKRLVKGFGGSIGLPSDGGAKASGGERARERELM